MSDLISRQAVLDKFKSLCDACGKDQQYNGVMCRACYLDDAISIVEDIPEAKRTAKVTDLFGKWGHCECGSDVFRPDENGWKYCPNCGARLEWK